MRALYAESSAVLRWLLGASDAPVLGSTLGAAEVVITSAVTAVEIARAMARLVAEASLGPAERDECWRRFSDAVMHWSVYAVDERVLARAAQSFPHEPVRTLDAIHLVTAARFTIEVAPLTMLSVDHRVRRNAQGLGIAVEPG